MAKVISGNHAAVVVPRRPTMPFMQRYAWVTIFLLSGLAMAGQNTARNSDESSISKILTDQQAAWNRGDGVAWARSFTDDADLVNIRGDVFHGRAEIAARHSAILEGPAKGSHITITIRRLMLLTPGVALIETDHELTGFTGLVPGIAATAPGVLRTRMSFVAIKRSDVWMLAAAQTTAIAPPVR